MLFFHRGGNSVADIGTGWGPKSLHFDKFTMLSLGYSFCPRGGPNSIANFDGGAMAGFAPSGSATGRTSVGSSIGQSRFSSGGGIRQVVKIYMYLDPWSDRPSYRTGCEGRRERTDDPIYASSSHGTSWPGNRSPSCWLQSVTAYFMYVSSYVYVCVCMYVCMYVRTCMYVYVCVCIYV